MFYSKNDIKDIASDRSDELQVSSLMITAYLGLHSVPDDSTSEKTHKNLYFCMIGLTLTIIAFLLHSYVF